MGGQDDDTHIPQEDCGICPGIYQRSFHGLMLPSNKIGKRYEGGNDGPAWAYTIGWQMAPIKAALICPKPSQQDFDGFLTLARELQKGLEEDDVTGEDAEEGRQGA